MHQRNVGIAFCADYNPVHGHLWGLVFLTVDDSIGDRGVGIPLSRLCITTPASYPQLNFLRTPPNNSLEPTQYVPQ